MCETFRAQRHFLIGDSGSFGVVARHTPKCFALWDASQPTYQMSPLITSRGTLCASYSASYPRYDGTERSFIFAGHACSLVGGGTSHICQCFALGRAFWGSFKADVCVDICVYGGWSTAVEISIGKCRQCRLASVFVADIFNWGKKFNKSTPLLNSPTKNYC